MRFLTIIKSPERDTPPSDAEIATMSDFITQGAQAGWLLSTEGCMPSKLGARVRLSNGTLTVTDGPFTEAKEVVGGFAIIEADSKEDAIALTEQFLAVAGDGECEIRQLYPTPAFDSAQARPA